ncbi:hypothetical protein SDC9_165480 [bioreactor metagenome]|uniref:Uncharacterized protein n=1 Tax=bioreactor metagenome TaxID=1076179 RepID=A0A645FWP8_9ZZZZ
MFNGFCNVGSDQSQLAEPARAPIRTGEINAPQLFYGRDVFCSSIVEGGGEPHQPQVGSHGFAAVASPNDSEVNFFVHFCDSIS